MSDGEKPKTGKVGYCNPPAHSRFQKGKSGNPKGRERGHKGLKTDLEATLNKTVELENKLSGEYVKGRNQLHIVERLVQRAALGDIKAQSLLFPLILQTLGAEDRHKGARKLSTLDQEILNEVLGSRASEVADGPESAELIAHAGGNGNRLSPPVDGALADDGDDPEPEDHDDDA